MLPGQLFRITGSLVIVNPPTPGVYTAHYCNNLCLCTFHVPLSTATLRLFNLFDSKAVTSAAVVASPVNATVGSIQTTPDMDPSTVGTSTGDDE